MSWGFSKGRDYLQQNPFFFFFWYGCGFHVRVTWNLPMNKAQWNECCLLHLGRSNLCPVHQSYDSSETGITELTNFKVDEEDSTMGWNLGRKQDRCFLGRSRHNTTFFFLTKIWDSLSFPQYFLTILIPTCLFWNKWGERIARPENQWSCVEGWVLCSPFCRIVNTYSRDSP